MVTLVCIQKHTHTEVKTGESERYNVHLTKKFVQNKHMSSQGGGSELQAGMILYTLTGQLVSTRLGPLVLSELPLFFMVI